MRLGFAAAVCLLALAPAPARADGIYLSEGFGGSQVGDDLAMHTDGGFRLRWAIGYRADRLSLEAFLGLDLPAAADVAAEDPPLTTYGLDAKYAFRLGGRFEIYLRGSMSRMTIDSGPLSAYAGRGLGLGTGIQIKGKVPAITLLYPPIALVCLVPDLCKKLGPKATVALFVDQGYDFYRLHGPGATVDAEVTRWIFGLAAGSDF